MSATYVELPPTFGVMTHKANATHARTATSEKKLAANHRRPRNVTSLAMVIAALHSVLAGCGSEPSPNEGSSTGPGSEGALPPAPPPPPVQGIANVGIFVSSSRGLADGDGTKARPLGTLAAAIAVAKSKNLPVNACAETYTEAVTLLDGVTMYGYFDCRNDWKRVTTHATITSSTSPAVLAENLALPSNFEGFDIAAPDIAGAAKLGTVAETSYGMIVRASKNLSIAEVTLRAGKGQDGADGAEAEENVELSSSTKGGAAESQHECAVIDPKTHFKSCPYLVATAAYSDGSPGGVSQCKVGPNGGPGGTGGAGPIFRNGNPVQPMTTEQAYGKPLVATAETAAGGTGRKGADGVSGVNGTHGQWSFDQNGTFVPGNGSAGSVGAPGQGGGGGNGSMRWYFRNVDGTWMATSAPDGVWYGATGAGGGAGGCGGVPGESGRGGGASIGLLVVTSETITLEKSRIESGKGGRAGRGAVGTAGLPGSSGGPIDGASYSGKSGADGGNGGPAGMSGHGAPGPSIGLAFKGSRPAVKDGVEIVPGSAGDGIGITSQGTQTLPAVTGEAKAEYGF